MKKRKNYIIIIALTICLSLGLSQNPGARDNLAFAMGAKDFTDIERGYWGYDYINFSAGKGIINGYLSSSGTYRFLPENSVSREESMAMIYRALDAAGKLKSKEDFSNDYINLFTVNKISGWAGKYIAYALKYGIIEEKELIDFTDDLGYGTPAPREQIAQWTAKAMNKGLAPAYSLDYADKDSISSEYIPYVDLLYRQGIMKGDDTNRFHPAAGIKRVEFAVICNRLYETQSSEVFDSAKESRSYRGTILSVDTNSNKIMMTESNGTARIIQANSKAQIVIDGKRTYNGLKGVKTGSIALVAWGAFDMGSNIEKSEIPLQLHIITKAESRIGLLTAIHEKDTSTSVLSIENADGDAIYYILDKNSKTGKNLMTGKEVTFITDGIKILEIK